MNKTVKIIATLLLAVMLVATLSQVVLATNYSSIIKDVDEKGKGTSDDVSGFKEIAGRVIKAIRNVAAIAAVVIVSILGIKYMIGSTEERADYKKSFIPLIVGIVVVVGAAQIATMLFSVSG